MTATIGVDLSFCQGPNVPFEELMGYGVKFSICKGSHGSSGEDPTFKRNWKAAKQYGFVRGMYMWLVPEQDPIVQINHAFDVLDSAGGIEDTDLPLSIDFEQQTTMAAERLIDVGVRAIARAKELNKRRHIFVYTGNWYWQAFCKDIDSPEFAAEYLWHSGYPSSRRKGTEYAQFLEELDIQNPALALPWRSRGVQETIWQFDGNGGLTLPNGVDADFNRFNGPLSSLQAIVADGLMYRLPPAIDTGWAPRTDAQAVIDSFADTSPPDTKKSPE